MTDFVHKDVLYTLTYWHHYKMIVMFSASKLDTVCIVWQIYLGWITKIATIYTKFLGFLNGKNETLLRRLRHTTNTFFSPFSDKSDWLLITFFYCVLLNFSVLRIVFNVIEGTINGFKYRKHYWQLNRVKAILWGRTKLLRVR